MCTSLFLFRSKASGSYPEEEEGSQEGDKETSQEGDKETNQGGKEKNAYKQEERFACECFYAYG
jgi:hypothetical protein